MDDSIKTVSAVKELGIKTFIAMNNFNLDFKDDKIINIYNMDQFFQEITNLDNNK